MSFTKQNIKKARDGNGRYREPLQLHLTIEMHAIRPTAQQRGPTAQHLSTLKSKPDLTTQQQKELATYEQITGNVHVPSLRIRTHKTKYKQ